jgi:hypothetical protein
VRLELLRALGWSPDAGTLTGGPTSGGALTDTEHEKANRLARAAGELRLALDNGAVLPDDLATMLAAVVGDDTNADNASDAFSVRTAALCSRVQTFGMYTTLPVRDGAYTLRAGRSQRAIVYAELEGVTSERSSDAVSGTAGGTVAGYASRLEQRVDLYFDGTDRLEPDADLLVWSSSTAAIQDFSRSERTDFFTVQPITLPSNLSVGRYTLVLIVRDKVSGSVAESSVTLEVTAR